MITKLTLFSQNSIQHSNFTRYVHGLTNSTINNVNLLKKIFTKYNKPINYERLVAEHANVNKLTKASVLVPVSVKEIKSGTSTKYQTFYTLTQRTPNLKFYGGQICFMGGKFDALDANVIETALREAKEEVNIDSSRLTLLAQMHPLITTNVGSDSFLLYPIVVYYDNHDFTPVLNKDEVDSLYELPTERFLSSENHDISHVQLKGDEFYLHYFSDVVNHQTNAEISVWGITALISIIVSTALHGKAPGFPIDPHIHIDPSDVNKFFDDFVLHKSIRLLDTLNKKKG